MKGTSPVRDGVECRAERVCEASGTEIRGQILRGVPLRMTVVAWISWTDSQWERLLAEARMAHLSSAKRMITNRKRVV